MIELRLTDQNTKEFDQAIKQEMDKAIRHFERELITIRTGRAHPALVEDIQVTCYGSSVMRLRELASIATPEARLITITPWDRGVLGDIEKAIMLSDLGVTPINDGTIVRITLPDMSTQRREELGKLLAKKLEDAKVAIRNVRKEFNNLIRDELKEKNISEDHSRRLNEHLQKITDDFIAQCDKMAEKKRQEIMTV
ncbi:MAG: ribosome recycling factor [Candidatus Babeliales bacterium]